MAFRKQLFCFLTFFYLLGHFILSNWQTRIYHGDSNGYYLHVVSFFVNQDVGDYDQTITSLIATSPKSADPRKDKFGIRKTEKGRNYIKYTVGVGLMETPFFLLAHAYATLSDQYKADGWSWPYVVVVNLSIVFYVLLGFYLLIPVLQKYYANRIVAYTIISIALATNLFYQSTMATMAHGFLFFHLCLLLYLTIRFYTAPSNIKAFGVGATIGLITITRVPEVISVFVPLLWGVYNWDTLKKRCLFFRQHFQYLLLACLGFLLLFSLQVIYWHYVSGHLFFNPYQGEGFNFWQPNIYKGWFHFKNGWLIYTPIMAFSLIGWFLLKKYNKGVQWAVFSFVFLNAWIHYSYYIWNYFPGLGSRPMVETYPLLAFGLATFYQYSESKSWFKWLPIPMILFFVWLNLFQTWQVKQGVIWTQNSNGPFYWETFGRMTSSIESLRAYDTKEFQPDTTKLKHIQTIVFEGFEDSSRFSVASELQYSGVFSLFNAQEFPDCQQIIPFKDHNLQAKDWIYVGIKAYRKEAAMVRRRAHLELLVVELYDEKNHKKKWTHIKFPSHIGNKNHSIWHTGVVNRWGEGGFFIRLPRKVNEGWTMKVKVWNPHGQALYLDDFRVEQYRE